MRLLTKRTRKFLFGSGIIAASIFGIYLFFGDHLVEYEVNITEGCYEEFCVGNVKSETIPTIQNILAAGNAELSYKNTNISTTDPQNMNLEKLLNDDRWTLFFDSKFGFRKVYYVWFDGDTIIKIKIVKYGPFYWDL